MTNGNDGTRTLEYGISAPAYRLPAPTRVGGIVLQVANLERSIAWYQRVLGARLLERSTDRAVLGPESASRLIELRERPGAAPVPRRGRLGLYHYAILLPSREALGAFVRHLSELGEPAGASDHLVSEALYLRDPDGLGIEVYADRPREAWRHEGGQLTMSTQPLDLDDLVRAAGGGRWGGMPPGTSIGHLHLHVGDLERAAAFYHEAVGLDKVVWSYPGALFLSAGGYHHHLGLNTWAAGAGPAGDRDARLVEWELLVPSTDDVARALESLTAAGYPAERSDSGLLTRDLWGTELRIRAAREGPPS